jgi:hypothetical protein
MFEMMVYLMLSWAALAGVAALFRLPARFARGLPAGQPAAARRVATVVFWCAYAAVPLAPYVLVEGQTALLGPSIRSAILRQFRMDGDPSPSLDMLKVTCVAPDHVDAYCIFPCSDPGTGEDMGAVYELAWSRSGWRVVNDSDPAVAWSDCGSADGSVFPPYGGQGEP